MNTIQVVRVNLTLKIKIQLELHEQFWNGQSALNSNFFSEHTTSIRAQRTQS